MHEFLNNYEFWNYYHSDMVNPFVDEEAARDFILGYFQSACKGNVTYEWERFEEVDLHFRDTHVIYVFFIGAILQYMIDPRLEIESNISPYNDGYKFSYLWFLTCLAHDLGYIYEYKDIKREIEEMQELCNYYAQNWRVSRFYDVRRRVYNRFFPNIRRISPSIPLNFNMCYDKRKWRRENKNYNFCGRTCKGNLQFNNGTKISQCWYTYDLKERYFRYRLLKSGKLDHGIVGADKFFSDMVKMYWKNFEEDLEYGTFECFQNTKFRTFSCEQFKVWAYIADCIASHNIFQAEDNENDRKLYEEYELQELLRENYVSISYNKNPLLFILCVADTLEPTKKFRNMDACEIFENMELDYDTVDNRIYLKISKALTEEIGYKDYIKGVNELREWCDIEVEVL